MIGCDIAGSSPGSKKSQKIQMKLQVRFQLDMNPIKQFRSSENKNCARKKISVPTSTNIAIWKFS